MAKEELPTWNDVCEQLGLQETYECRKHELRQQIVAQSDDKAMIKIYCKISDSIEFLAIDVFMRFLL